MLSPTHLPYPLHDLRLAVAAIIAVTLQETHG
jgi:hypothetical protein